MSVEQAARLLELPLPFTREQLRKAYLVALRVWHPDRFPHGDELHTLAKEKTRLIIEAHGILAAELGQSDIYPSPPRREAVPPERHTTQTPPPSGPAVGKWSKLATRLFQLIVMAVLIPPISYYVLPYFGLHPAPLAGRKPAFIPPPPPRLTASRQQPASVQPFGHVPAQGQAYTYFVVLDNGEKYQIDAYNELTQEQAYAGLIQNGNLAKGSTRRIILMTTQNNAVASGQSSAAPAPTSEVRAQVPSNAPVLLSDFDRLKARAEGGDPLSQYNLGVAYADGTSVAKDDAEAVRWYHKAAENKFLGAANNLGVAYATGTGVAKDNAAAVTWYYIDANRGDPDAQFSLGYHYAHGEGVPKDPVKAVDWYRRAAKQGNATAQWALGECYRYGQGVPQNKVSAFMLYKLAAAQGDEKAGTQLAALRYSMSPEQIAEAEQLAKNFRPQ